jgi:hypothetical protein
VNEVPANGGTSGSDAPAYASRYGYIDFGANWADVRITATWTLYRAWSAGDQSGYATMWWDDDYDNVNDNGVTESVLDFNSAQSIPNVSYTQWIQDVDCSSAPVAPQGRYLIIGSPATVTNRAKEYAIIGYTQ